MVRFRQKLDSAWKIYIPKVLRQSGFDKEVELAPNTTACVMYPSKAPLEQVIESLRIIQQDLEHSARLQKERRK